MRGLAVQIHCFGSSEFEPWRTAGCPGSRTASELGIYLHLGPLLGFHAASRRQDSHSWGVRDKSTTSSEAKNPPPPFAPVTSLLHLPSFSTK